MAAPVPEAGAVYSFRVWLPERPLTPNSRVHWGRRASNTKQIRECVAVQARSQFNKLKPKLTYPVIVKLTYSAPKGGHTLDGDNLAASLKALRDSLVDAGWIPNDRPQDATFTYEQGENSPTVIPWVLVEVGG